jgi:hypothetical protein
MPYFHREAHYGEDAAALEEKFIERIKQLT